MSLYINAADRAFVRHLIREMRAAIAANPEAPTVTTGPLDPDILEHVLAVAMQNSAPAEARSPHPVAWRCKDFADGWIIYQQESAAAAYRAETGCLMEPLYALPTPPKAEADHGE